MVLLLLYRDLADTLWNVAAGCLRGLAPHMHQNGLIQTLITHENYELKGTFISSEIG